MEIVTGFFQEIWGPIVLLIGAIVGFFTQLSKILSGWRMLRDSMAVWFGDRGIENEVIYFWPDELSSRYANERWELQEILEIRKKYFVEYLKQTVISDDKSYWAAYENNKSAFSVVSEGGEAFGYWGLIPVSKEHFLSFLAGELTHADMLSKAVVLSWRDADPKELYLYHIGAVTLPVHSPGSPTRGIPIRAAKVELDNIALIYAISRHANISGLAVYPSTKEGAIAISKHFVKHGFTRTGILAVDEDPLTEIACLSGDNVNYFLNKLFEEYVEPHRSGKPVKWTRKIAKFINKNLVGPEFHLRVPRRRFRELASVLRDLKHEPVKG